MQVTQRRKVLAAALEVSRESQYSFCAPELTLASNAEHIASWLQWCDPNGCHTASNAKANNMPPYDLDGAWEALESMLEDRL